MKAKAHKHKPETSFEPIDITITLQSQYEVACLYSLFNFQPITKYAGKYGLKPDIIRDELENITDIEDSPEENECFEYLQDNLVNK